MCFAREIQCAEFEEVILFSHGWKVAFNHICTSWLTNENGTSRIDFLTILSFEKFADNAFGLYTESKCVYNNEDNASPLLI